ncbi:MAG: tetratricopeptide repeat protein [Candidatus Riflebacteria bacterium]|nr:tetratricopeptide repeat protein [Candidatus Riflebacteria bacterium]
MKFKNKIALLALTAAFYGNMSPLPASENDRKQETLLRREVMDFMKKSENREPGEGYIFLAGYYRELNKVPQALEQLDKTLRASVISPSLKWEARLMRADIYREEGLFDEALSDLEALLESSPAEAYMIRCKIARAEILGRKLTSVQTLIDSFKEYYKYFPQKREGEFLEYLIGFAKGYDLDVALKAVSAWEEIAEFREKAAKDYANLRLAMLYAYDLNKPEKGASYLTSLSENASVPESAYLVRATLGHFYQKNPDLQQIREDYTKYLERTSSIEGYRVAGMLLGVFEAEKAKDYLKSEEVFRNMMLPPKTVKDHDLDSFNLERRKEAEKREDAWNMQYAKMAGYLSEYLLQNPDKAAYYYRKVKDYSDKLEIKDPVNDAAIARTEPKISPADMAFDMAYEKYRAGDYKTALKLYKKFVADYPHSIFYKEALFRIAVITDDDLRDYPTALRMYREYTDSFRPVKSGWDLDAIYDWGRVDEAEYRIGNVYSRHMNDPVKALKVFETLLQSYPDSYWAKLGLQNSVTIQSEVLSDKAAANSLMTAYIEAYPSDGKSSEYRKILYESYREQDDIANALNTLKNYLENTMPNEAEYFKNKELYNELLLLRRADYLRGFLSKKLNSSEVAAVYGALADTAALASSSAPLKKLYEEIMAEERLNETERYDLSYEIARAMYFSFPSDSKELFSVLSENASGTAKLRAVMTLGNIAYIADKDVETAVKRYEEAETLTELGDSEREIISYRLGRLYFVQGYGIKGLEKLNRFLREFPRSVYSAKAYMAMGDACIALHSPEEAKVYYKRAMIIDEALQEKAEKKIKEASEMPTTREWLAKRLQSLRKTDEELLETGDETAIQGASLLPEGVKNFAEIETSEIENLPPETVYAIYMDAIEKPEVDSERLLTALTNLLERDDSSEILKKKAARRLISEAFFRQKIPYADFVTEAERLLLRHNYPEWLSELYFRMAQAQDIYTEEYEKAAKNYIEFISFFPASPFALQAERRIPAVYAASGDYKNATKFYERFISDKTKSEESRTEAALELAKLHEEEDDKPAAIRTLRSVLTLESSLIPEICVRLEKLTGRFDYIEEALKRNGDEKIRLIAFQRLLEQQENSGDYRSAVLTMADYADTFKEPESKAYIVKKRKDLQKRGEIEEVESLIDAFPEEEATPYRMFKLAKLLENTQHELYRPEDLFYEITLVYPHLEIAKESKIRADNIRAVNALSDLELELMSNPSAARKAEIFMAKAQLMSEFLHDYEAASALYDEFLREFPNDRQAGDAALKLARLKKEIGGEENEVRKLLELALLKTANPVLREQIMQELDASDLFSSDVASAVSAQDKTHSDSAILYAWNAERNLDKALELIKTSLSDPAYKSNESKLLYWQGRILEEKHDFSGAESAYEKAYKSFEGKGCRKDMLLYRLARLSRTAGNEIKSIYYYQNLVTSYPHSTLAKSAYYSLAKHYEENGDYSKAYESLNILLKGFPSLHPDFREKLFAKLKEIEGKKAVKDIEKMQADSSSGELYYYLARLLEYDLGDYDASIKQYERYLQENPPIFRVREVLNKLSELYFLRSDFVKSLWYLDMLLETFPIEKANLKIISKIGELLETKISDTEMTFLFYKGIEREYARVPEVRRFASGRLREIERKKKARPSKKAIVKIKKREYTDEDKEVLKEMKEIVVRQIEDLQDFKKAERLLEELWEENPESFATLDIMEALVKLNMEQLRDPHKASVYYSKWLKENPGDPLHKKYTMLLYDHYMDVLADGQSALRLLEDFLAMHPVSLDTLDIELKLGKANELLLKNYDEALRCYNNIIDTEQNEAVVHEAYYRIGFVYRNGFANYDEAIRTWQKLNASFYNNQFAPEAEFAIAYTYEAYLRDYSKARAAYQNLLGRYPNTSLINEARDALRRIEGK